MTMMKYLMLLERRCLAAILVGASCLGSGGQVARGQAPDEATSGDAATDPVYLSWQQQPGVQACGGCHYQATAGFAKPDVSFSRRNELQFWLANDKHAIARRRFGK